MKQMIKKGAEISHHWVEDSGVNKFFFKDFAIDKSENIIFFDLNVPVNKSGDYADDIESFLGSVEKLYTLQIHDDLICRKVIANFPGRIAFVHITYKDNMVLKFQANLTFSDTSLLIKRKK